MNVLIMSQAYPSINNPYQMMYVHNRTVHYLKDMNVSVLSFNTKKNYVYEGVPVYCEKDINLNDYDLIISHAPNIRNHFRVLSFFSGKILFFIHGHEALNYTKYYPGKYDSKDYKFSFLRRSYERFKLNVFKLFIHLKDKVSFCFVSQWMKDEFEKNVMPIENRNYKIIHNGVNDIFLNKTWDIESKKEFDFITIRPLTEKKYAVDVVISLAKQNPEKKFALYGKGNIFEHINKPDNIIWFDCFVEPKDMPSLLDTAKVALMPTRLDAQGVMMCEMATYGIPMITSDLPVCISVLDGFKNVFFINNNSPKLPQLELIDYKNVDVKNDKFSQTKLARNEKLYIEDLLCLN